MHPVQGEVYEGIDGIKHALMRKKNRFYMIMYRGAGEGHECCAQTSKSGVGYYFDSNFGEALLWDCTRFADWYEKYLSICDYKTTYARKQKAVGYKFS